MSRWSPPGGVALSRWAGWRRGARQRSRPRNNRMSARCTAAVWALLWPVGTGIVRSGADSRGKPPSPDGGFLSLGQPRTDFGGKPTPEPKGPILGLIDDDFGWGPAPGGSHPRGGHAADRADQYIPPMPPPMPPAAAIAGFSSFRSTTTHSVVRSKPAIDAAFWSAVRVTLVGSITPAFTRSS
jgi:hypothetical protein